MSRPQIPSFFFAIVVVRKGHRFLMVHEKGGEWYFPGGGVLPKEGLYEAAERETLEESGIPVFIEGIYKLEYIASPDNSGRFRAVFVARPVDDTDPKKIPDSETLGADWKTLEEIEALPLRSKEVLEILRDINSGATIYPKSLFRSERLKVH